MGTILVEARQARVENLKKRIVVLDGAVSNVPAILFYQRHSFVEESINKGFIRFSKPV